MFDNISLFSNPNSQENINFNSVYDWVKEVGSTRYYSHSGGRGCLKTVGGADVAIDRAINSKYEGSNIICLREYATSIKKSSYNAVKKAIIAKGLKDKFRFLNTEILCPSNNTTMHFGGCQNPENWKGASDVSLLWGDEMEKVDRYALDVICPTIRGDTYNPDKYNTTILFTYNPLEAIDDVASFCNDYKDICTFKHSTIFDIPEQFRNKDLLLEAGIDKKRDISMFYWKWLGKPSPMATKLLFKNIHLHEKPLLFKDCFAWLDPSFIGGDTTALTLFKAHEGKIYIKGYCWHMSWLDAMPFIVDVLKKNKVAKFMYEANGLYGAIDDHVQTNYSFSADWKASKIKKTYRINRIIQYLNSFIFVQENTPENNMYIKQLKEYNFKKTTHPKTGDYDDAPDSLATGAYEFNIIR